MAEPQKLYLQDVLAAAPPLAVVTGSTKLLTPDLKTVEVQGLPFAQPQEVTFGTAKVYGNFVTGYAFGGLPNSDTQNAINYALAQGYPDWAIQWRYLGEGGAAPIEAGSVSAASVSLRPTVAAPSLMGTQIGNITAAPVSLRPATAAPSLAGTQAGTISAAALSLRPTVSAPALTGVQVGNIGAAAVSLTPYVSVGTLTGIQEGVGVIGAASVSLRPEVSAPSLTGVSIGSIDAAGVTLQPTVAAGIIYSGTEAPVSVTLTPAPGAVILYTLDGSPPLDYIVTSDGLAVFSNGELVTTGDVQ